MQEDVKKIDEITNNIKPTGNLIADIDLLKNLEETYRILMINSFFRFYTYDKYNHETVTSEDLVKLYLNFKEILDLLPQEDFSINCTRLNFIKELVKYEILPRRIKLFALNECKAVPKVELVTEIEIDYMDCYKDIRNLIPLVWAKPETETDEVDKDSWIDVPIEESETLLPSGYPDIDFERIKKCELQEQARIAVELLYWYLEHNLNNTASTPEDMLKLFNKFNVFTESESTCKYYNLMKINLFRGLLKFKKLSQTIKSVAEDEYKKFVKPVEPWMRHNIYFDAIMKRPEI